MKIGLLEAQEILKTVQTPGFHFLMGLLDDKISSLTEEISFPKSDLNEDSRVLNFWRGYIAVKKYLTEVPLELGKEFNRQTQTAAQNFVPNQQPLFQGFDETAALYKEPNQSASLPIRPPPNQPFLVGR